MCVLFLLHMIEESHVRECAETLQGGLVITDARYGVLDAMLQAERSGTEQQQPESSGRPADEPWIDVTTALRFMVDDGRVLLHPVRFICVHEKCFLLQMLKPTFKHAGVQARADGLLRPGARRGEAPARALPVARAPLHGHPRRQGAFFGSVESLTTAEEATHACLQEGGSLPQQGELASGEGEAAAILAAAQDAVGEWHDNALFGS